MIGSIQQQLQSFWTHQTRSQKVTLVALVLAALIIIPLLISWATAPSYSVAFSGLTEEDAGQIVQTLDEQAIPYKLQSTGTILVPSNRVYEVRLLMARNGLPQSSTVGFELFDSASFGMTEFTQRVNYQRALEGELERTIGSLDSVEAVQVHIVTPEQTLLTSEQQPTTASITIQVRAGRTIDQSQVRAITHLVASAVEGLKPENVVIVDSEGNLLAGTGISGDDALAATQTDARRAAETVAANEIKAKVQNMLDSTLGPNKAVVQVAVVLDWTQGEVTSQTYNPTPAAVRSSQNLYEAYSTDGSTLGGVPGAASNLPTPVATTVGGTGGIVYERSEDTYNYEINQTESHEILAPGAIQRISLSVLVDGITDTNQLATIQSAVAAAAGIDATRGDQVVVQTMAFDRTYYEEQAAALEESSNMDLYIRIGEAVAAALVLFGLLWYIFRLFKNLKLASSEAWTPVMRPVAEMALGQGPAGAGAMFGQPAVPAGMLAEAAIAVEQKPIEPLLAKVPEFVMPKASTPSFPEDDALAKELTKITQDNPASIAEIIQLWLNEDEKRHG